MQYTLPLPLPLLLVALHAAAQLFKSTGHDCHQQQQRERGGEGEGSAERHVVQRVVE